MNGWFTRRKRHAPKDARMETPIHRRPILLVEDEEPDREHILPVLDALGFAVDIAVDDIDGLRQDDQHEYAGAIVDLNLSGSDRCEGLALIAELRKRGRRYPIVILTYNNRIGYRIKGFEAGANDYVVKWPPREELRTRLGRLISGNRVNWLGDS